MKKIMPVSRSMSGNDFVDFNADISIALEYTGSPVHHGIPAVFPVDVDWIPTAKAVASPDLLNHLSLPVVEPIVRNCLRATKEVGLGSKVSVSRNHANDHVSHGGFHGADDGVERNFDGNGDLKRFLSRKDDDGILRESLDEGLPKSSYGIESSGTLGFSDSQDHSHELSESSDMVETPIRDNEIGLGSRVDDSKHRLRDANDHVSRGGFHGADDGVERNFDGNGDLKSFFSRKDDDDGILRESIDEVLPKSSYGIESSGTLGFSDSQDHSHELSESSDMVETPIRDNEIEGFQNYMNPANWNSTEPSLTPRAFSAEIYCEEEEEVSDGEELECRRKKKTTVTFCDSDMVSQDESVDDTDGIIQERRVPERPAKRGMCYRCHKGNRLTEKEACIVCDAKYCRHCILRAMGSMPEGRKCLDCIGFPIDESKRQMVGKCSRVLRGLLNDSEVKQIMISEISCAANQLPPECVRVNGRPLCLEELMLLRSCPNPPRNLKPGNYWYDRVCGFWGKEGHKPCQIITPQLDVGDSLKRDASNGNTDVVINNREITKAELWMLQSAGVQCAGKPTFWVHADGTCQEEGMNLVKGKIWGRKRTKLVCTLLSLPTPESPNSVGQFNHDGVNPRFSEQRELCKILLVGNDRSGTSTIFKQARVLYNIPFSEEERENIKFMIQGNFYGYLGRLLEGREQFEEESLEMRRRQSIDQPGPSDKTEYTIGPRLKAFSDWLINVMVSGNLDIIFPAATREYAPYVEELWRDGAIQATLNRRDELDLPPVASYFLDRAVEIAKVDYEPSSTDIFYAEGVTCSGGLVSMEFSFPQTTHDGYGDPVDQPDPVPRYQLVRTHAKSLGEKCKWLEMFEDVGIVLFCVALTDYDEYEIDNNGVLTNKMLQTRRLFESIITRPTFEETNFLLVLNKFDLLEEKIEKIPLRNCEWFQDFNPVISRHSSNKRNGNNIAPLAQLGFHYIALKFKSLFKSLTGRKLYVCPTTGLEPDTIDSALRYAREIIRWDEDKLNFSLNESSCESIEIEHSSY